MYKIGKYPNKIYSINGHLRYKLYIWNIKNSYQKFPKSKAKIINNYLFIHLTDDIVCIQKQN